MSTNGESDGLGFIPLIKPTVSTTTEVEAELRSRIGDLAEILSKHIFDGPRNKLIHGSATVAHVNATLPTVITIETWLYNPYTGHGWERSGEITLGSYDLKDALKLIDQREALRRIDKSVLS